MNNPYGLSPQRTRELMAQHGATVKKPVLIPIGPLPKKTEPKPGPTSNRDKHAIKRIRRGIRKVLLTMGLGDPNRILIHKDHQTLIFGFGRGKKHGRTFKTKINKYGTTHRDHLIVTRLT